MLRLITASLWFAFVATLVYWMLRNATMKFLEGQQLLLELEGYRVAEAKTSPLLAKLGFLGAGFLPLIKGWAANNTLGMTNRLRQHERLLVMAGIRAELTPERFMSATLTLSLLGGLGLFLVIYLLDFGFIVAVLFGFPVGLALGFYLPGMIVKGRVSERVTLIDKRLPFAVEFMLLAMEASAAFSSAIEVYCKQMPRDPLADELRLVLVDIESGLSPQHALNNLNARIESANVAAFVLGVTTGLDTGQPVKEVLQIQADLARQRRYQAAEEIAKKASTKAVFPLFIALIAVFILLIAPMIIRLTQLF